MHFTLSDYGEKCHLTYSPDSTQKAEIVYLCYVCNKSPKNLGKMIIN